MTGTDDNDLFEPATGEGWRPAAILYCSLLALAAVLIWWPSYFFATDAPAHLHGASLFLELMSGGGSGFYELNRTVVPNSLGHWMMALLLEAFSPGAVSKIMATVTWAAFTASVAWLRFSIRGTDGLGFSVVFGAVLAFNFLWLLGLYNFILGAAAALTAIGCIHKWDGEVGLKRAAILSTLFVLSFLGHLVAFGTVLLAALIFSAVTFKKNRLSSYLCLAAAFLPVVPFLAAYQVANNGEAGLAPRWGVVESGFSISSLANHLRHTDPLTMIGGHNVMPFVGGESNVFVLASPLLWSIVAVVVLALGSLHLGWRGWIAKHHGAIAVAMVLMFCSLAAPDEFGSTHGSVLRPRLLLLAAALTVPILPSMAAGRLRIAAYAFVGVAVAFQFLALFEYSLRSRREAGEFLAASAEVPAGGRIASVMIFENDPKFHESPIKRASSIVGIETGSIVWDNYETGYFFFPVIAAEENDRQFIRYYSALNAFRTRGPDEYFDPVMIDGFRTILGNGLGEIDTLMVWGRDDKVDGIIAELYGPQPYFENGGVRLFRKRN